MSDLRCPKCGSQQTGCCAPPDGFTGYIKTELWEVSLPAAHELIDQLRAELAKANEEIDELQHLLYMESESSKLKDRRIKELETMLTATEAELVVAIADYREEEAKAEEYREALKEDRDV